MENKSKELTFIDILEIIFKRKILLAAITLIITIAGTLFLGVVYSNNTKQYTTSFTLEYPGNENLTLPDGSNLKYTDFISEESLLKVKNSNANYKDIDVNAIASSNDISITQEIVLNSANKNDTVYTINIKSKHFPNSTIAKSFIKDLAILPIIEIREMAIISIYDNYLESYDKAVSYDNKLLFLSLQKSYLSASYNKATEQFGNLKVNGQPLNVYQQQIDNYFRLNSLDLLVDEFNREGYAPKNEVLATKYQTEIDSLENKYQNNQAVINAIREEIGKIEYENKEIDVTNLTELVEENITIAKKIEVLQNKLKYSKGELINETKYSAFIAKMNTFHSKIVDFTNEYINNINNIYEKLSFVSFSSSSAVLQQGGMSFLVAGMASFMVGIVIASCTILILNAIKNKKKQTNII